MILELNHLLAFLIASIGITLLPGPDNLFVLSTSLLKKKKAGIATALGMASGNFVHTAAVALGVAAVIAAKPVFLKAITLLGVAYLLYLAWQSWHAPSLHQRKETTSTAENATTEISQFSYFKRGFLMNLLNPKVLLFFLAFLPQFINQHQGNQVAQIFLLGSIFVVQAGIIFCGIALMAQPLQPALQRVPGRWIPRASSAVFIGLSLYLLLV